MTEFDIMTKNTDYDYSKVKMFENYCTNPIATEEPSQNKPLWLDDLGWL